MTVDLNPRRDVATRALDGPLEVVRRVLGGAADEDVARHAEAVLEVHLANSEPMR